MSGFFRKKLISNISLIVVAIVSVLLIVVIANKTRLSLVSKAQQSAGTGCSTLHGTVPVPPGWGASFDVFGPAYWQNDILGVYCLNDSVELVLGQYRPEQYFYKT